MARWGNGLSAEHPGTRYQLEDEDVFILYSSSDSELNECIRRLPTDIVLKIMVTPDKPRSLDALGLNENALSRLSPSRDMPFTTALIDDDQGVVVSTNTVSPGVTSQTIAYLPLKAERSRCLDYYGDLSRFIYKIACILCPTVAVSCPDETKIGSTAIFTANVMIGSPPPKLNFTWTVEHGKISEGQGTPSITVDTSDVKSETITATVEVGGIDPACNRTASCSTKVNKSPNERRPN